MSTDNYDFKNSIPNKEILNNPPIMDYNYPPESAQEANEWIEYTIEYGKEYGLTYKRLTKSQRV